MAEIEGSGKNRETGITRRELIKRGAFVGGTVVWATPVIQSVASPAMAQRGSPDCGCCYCFNGPPDNPTDDLCNENGDSGPRADPAACAAFCAGQGFADSHQCSEFVGGCACHQITDPGVDPGENGCSCT
jgi:hypothetical protein